MSTVPNPLPFANVKELLAAVLLGEPHEFVLALDHVLMWLFVLILIRYFLRLGWYER